MAALSSPRPSVSGGSSTQRWGCRSSSPANARNDFPSETRSAAIGQHPQAAVQWQPRPPHPAPPVRAVRIRFPPFSETPQSQHKARRMRRIRARAHMKKVCGGAVAPQQGVALHLASRDGDAEKKLIGQGGRPSGLTDRYCSHSLIFPPNGVFFALSRFFSKIKC